MTEHRGMGMTKGHLSPELQRLEQLLVQVLDTWPDRPEEAWLLMLEVYETFHALPARERERINEAFHAIAAMTMPPN